MNLVANKWSIFLLILPFMSVYYFNLNFILPFTYLGRIISVILIIYIITKIKKIDYFSILLIVYLFLMLFSSFINNTLTFGILYSIITTFGFCALINYYGKNFYSEMLKGLYFLFSILTVINFVLMIVKPDGIAIGNNFNSIYLLGAKNGIQMVLIPAISIFMLYSYFFYKKLKKISTILIFISLITLYISESGTAFTVMILMSGFLIFHKKIFLSFKTYFLIYIFLYLAIVIFRIQEVIFGDFLINALGKDPTFTGRTEVWDIVINKIRESWLFGFGRGNDILMIETTSSKFYFGLSEAHNGILEILLSTGMIGLLAFLIIIFIVGRKLSSYKNSIISQILAFSLFCYMIVGLSESVFNRIEFWLLLTISYNIDKISNEKINELRKDD